MTRAERLEAFQTLGTRLQKLHAEQDAEWLEVLTRARLHNPWFSEANLDKAVQGIVHYLAPNALAQWVQAYPEATQSLKVGVVMAGNIPLVGFHDFLAVLISGHSLLAKLSSQDEVLLRFLAKQLVAIAPAFENRIVFAERLNEADAFIATGSDNSARYFEYYFSKKPNIIRKNRTGLAVLSGNESPEALALLGQDLFTYFGLGCRNVSKLLVPAAYNFKPLFDALAPYTTLVDHNKYANNYDYHKAIFLMNNDAFLDSGFATFKMHDDLVSPLSVVYYQEHQGPEQVATYIESMQEKLQVVVAPQGFFNSPPVVPVFNFGQAQTPDLTDYADGADTMAFLTGL